MIDRITIKNFKSLRDISVELKPLTIIIGPNASGKSNLLDALEAIKRLVEYKGTMTSSQEGERATILVDELLWRKADPAEEALYWELHYSLPIDDQLDLAEYVHDYSYSLAVKKEGSAPNARPIISQENLKPLDPNNTIKSDIVYRDENIVVIQGTNDDVFADISLTDLALHFYAQEPFPAVRRLQRYIQGWSFYKIHPDTIRSEGIGRGKSRQLSKSGRNLANVLHYLREDEPEDFEYIQDEMQTTLGFSRLHTFEEDDGSSDKKKVYLEAEEERFAGQQAFGPDNLSDGTLGLLALLTLLGVSDLASLICLEEPEQSIHRQLIPSLAHYLHSAAYDTQLIVTTHSPEFLDHFDPYEQEYVQVLIAYRDQEGATQLVPLREVEHVEKWLEDYMLGQIWAMGKIEEVLEVA